MFLFLCESFLDYFHYWTNPLNYFHLIILENPRHNSVVYDFYFFEFFISVNSSENHRLTLTKVLGVPMFLDGHEFADCILLHRKRILDTRRKVYEI